ncbi:MAG: patatin family protein [Bacteroidales bacterium]|nr:patatin family protein [Bacteroidales bacterium]
MINITEKSGLILEGGGMRGVFTCGVLDCFMDNGIRFPYSIGVSAGACNGLSYISKQRGRAKFSNIDLLQKYNYIGIKHLLKKGNIMDFDLLFHTFPNEIIPYDYDMLANCKERFEMVTTSCRTGKACYYEEKKNADRVIDIVKASSSLPFVCPITYVDDEPMLDGGIADSIPILRARELGYDNNVVVLTRNKGYRKSEKENKIVSLFYKEYPAIQEAIRQRNKLYNKQISLVEQLEDAGEIVVIRPQRPIEVSRMERDIKKLMALYEEGYNLAMRNLK